MDRLAELQKGAEGDGLVLCVDLPSSSSAGADEVKRYEPIRGAISALDQYETQLHACAVEYKKCVDTKTRDDVWRHSLSITQQVHTTLMVAKQQLDHYKHDTQVFADKYPDRDATLQLKENLTWLHAKRLQDASQRCYKANDAFKQEVLEFQRRQLHIHHVPDHTIDKLMNDASEPSEVSAVLAATLSDDTASVIEDILKRNAQVHTLEANVKGMQALFVELATLIDQQQETLNHIETRVANSKRLTEKGARAIASGERYQKKDRKCKCWMIGVLCAVAFIVIGVPLLTR